MGPHHQDVPHRHRVGLRRARPEAPVHRRQPRELGSARPAVGTATLAGRQRRPETDRRLRPRHHAAAGPSLGAGWPLLRRARRGPVGEPAPADRGRRLVAVRGDPGAARPGDARRRPRGGHAHPRHAPVRRTAPSPSRTSSRPTPGAGRTRSSPTPRTASTKLTRAVARRPSAAARARSLPRPRRIRRTTPRRRSRDDDLWSLAANQDPGNVRLLDLDTLTDARAPEARSFTPARVTGPPTGRG